mgnify:FL=1
MVSASTVVATFHQAKKQLTTLCPDARAAKKNGQTSCFAVTNVIKRKAQKAWSSLGLDY